MRSALPAILLFGVALGGCSWAPPLPESTTGTTIAPARAPTTGDGYERYENNPVLLTARQMIGVNYAYGGHAPDTGFDCSGLVYYAHKTHGINLPRTAKAQYAFADPVNRDALRPGDLMFFRTSGKRISHVGLYLGPGRLLHAPSSGKQVTVADYRTTYWRARYAGAGRIRQASQLRTSAVQNPR